MKVATVTEERKYELLMEARRTRLDWVKSSTPYKQNPPPSSSSSTSSFSNERNTKKDPLDVLNNATIVKHLPSAIQVLNCLIQSKEKLDIETWKNKIDTQQNAIQSRNLVNVLDDDAFIFYYQEIIERLCMPESMDLVQGMRRFVRSFSDLVQVQLVNHRHHHHQQQQQPEPNLDKLVLSIQKYIASVYDTIASHPSWRGDDNTETKMMLETFIYSKCHDMIFNVLVTTEEEEEEKTSQNNDNDKDDDGRLSFAERLEFLQFVKPEHLEITCFVGIDEQPRDFWRSVFSRPIALLKSLDYLYSPSQMLRCILELYRAVNHALKDAVDQIIQDQQGGRTKDGEAEALPMMPSADDLLPTLILTMIYSQMTNIPIHLRFLELFATQDQLRGEAGYAFTNLLSAVHFIKEMDLRKDTVVESGKGNPMLQISPVELKQRLTDFQQSILSKQKHDPTSSKSVDGMTNDTKNEERGNDKHGSQDKETPNYSAKIINKHVRIPVSELVAARRRGEDITEWARNFIHCHFMESSSGNNDLDQTTCGEETGQSTRETDTLTEPQQHPPPPPPPLPEGFKRSYRFLATEPHEIRMSDVPSLLEEYRMLVRTTESLLVERQSLLSKQHDFVMKTKKDILKDAFLEASKNVVGNHETNNDTMVE
eukprot:CAMPEP_0176493056 /NCGR_PEP_ID=MMETSP0200_2-20121128/9352_1 /TAXON_ID=947934 /ORGANISM="Chaetoceros sp., Strain GSL56" /LENGTH=651 /DNA_ID=CAMNT_0017890707 /DNA_START=129 /DNA_END=2084 /DNA_ORIENTATION=+